MANDIDDIRSTLNGLIETLKDGEEGFRNSAEKLKDPTLASDFRGFANQRARFASELQAEVSRIGGSPETSGSTAGAIHRGWIDLKAALSGHTDLAILEEAERGEDSAVKNYRDALSKDVPSDIRSVIEGQYRDVLTTHNTVRTWRDASRVANGATAGTSSDTTRTY
jgi:uncharacterized protein (TIGR02284 family)